MKKTGFTLAEVLITLAIIGVVAALTIPSVVANTQQQEFKTGLKKAVSVLNSAITMNMAIEGETPYDTWDIYGYFMRHMSVMKRDVSAPCGTSYRSSGARHTHCNMAFYTTDGMRFEFRSYAEQDKLALQENPEIFLRGTNSGHGLSDGFYMDETGKTYSTDRNPNICRDNPSRKCGKCGSYGLANNENNTTNAPCYITVDVNGDRKPFPQNASCFRGGCAPTNIRKYSTPDAKRLTDTFTIMITDKAAIPYGVAAQKAMYEAQK